MVQQKTLTLPLIGSNPIAPATVQVFLSRRNLTTLLKKLDRVKQGEDSFCTLIKSDTNNGIYSQNFPRIAVTAVEDEDYYINRKPGVTVED